MRHARMATPEPTSKLRATSRAGQAPNAEVTDFDGRRLARQMTVVARIGRQDDIHGIVDDIRGQERLDELAVEVDAPPPGAPHAGYHVPPWSRGHSERRGRLRRAVDSVVIRGGEHSAQALGKIHLTASGPADSMRPG